VTRLVCTAIVAMLARATPAQEPVQARTGAAGEIRELEQALSDAMHRKDGGRIEGLLAPEYVMRGAPDIDRAAWIRNAVTLCWGERSDIDGFRVRLEADVAVASFELTFYVDPSSCRPALLRSLITDVWARRPEGWRLLLRHSGPAPPAGADLVTQYGTVPIPPPIWTATSEVSMVATGGNASTRTTGLAGSVTHRSQTTRTRFAADFVTAEADEVTRARTLTIGLRHGMRVGKQPELFISTAYSRDRFAGIIGRVTGEAGFVYAVRLPRPHTLTLDAGLGFTSEERVDPVDLQFATASGALHYTARVVPLAEFTQDLAVIADLGAARNWRGTSATALTVTLTRLLSLKASHAFEYRNTPVPGFKRADMRSSVAIVFSFERRPALPSSRLTRVPDRRHRAPRTASRNSSRPAR
jgi:putative salt-induced outer membrane protein YdiY